MNPFRNSQAVAGIKNLTREEMNTSATPRNAYGYGGVVQMTPAGAIEYAMRVHDQCEQKNWDRQADIEILKRRVLVLECELAALKTPSDTNWSA